MNSIGKIEQLTKTDWFVHGDGIVFKVDPVDNRGVVRTLKKYQLEQRKLNVWIRSDGILLGVKRV